MLRHCNAWMSFTYYIYRGEALRDESPCMFKRFTRLDYLIQYTVVLLSGLAGPVSHAGLQGAFVESQGYDYTIHDFRLSRVSVLSLGSNHCSLEVKCLRCFRVFSFCGTTWKVCIYEVHAGFGLNRDSNVLHELSVTSCHRVAGRGAIIGYRDTPGVFKSTTSGRGALYL